MQATHRTPKIEYDTRHVRDNHPTKGGAPAVLSLLMVSASIGSPPTDPIARKAYAYRNNDTIEAKSGHTRSNPKLNPSCPQQPNALVWVQGMRTTPPPLNTPGKRIVVSFQNVHTQTLPKTLCDIILRGLRINCNSFVL